MSRFLFVVWIGKIFSIFDPNKLRNRNSFSQKWKNYRFNIFDTPVRTVFPTIDATSCIKNWKGDLTRYAHKNTNAYLKFFVIENLLRLLINELSVVYTKRINSKISNYVKKNDYIQNTINIKILDVKCNNSHFLNLRDLIFLVKNSTNNGSLFDEYFEEFVHYRNIIAHSGMLSENSLSRLSIIYDHYIGIIEMILKDEFK